jgi:hypothetical protein
MLHDVFITINDVQGGVSALQYFRKLKEWHFKGNNFDAMSMKQSAQVMSNTMVKAIDQVCDHADEYPMEKCPPGYDCMALYSMVCQLCVHMNRFKGSSVESSYHSDWFIPDDTFSTLQYFLTKKDGRRLTLCRINQDINEHHFGNVRNGAGSHNNPNQ